MLSRFSSLFTYVIVGLVISAAATPMNPLGDTLGGGTKSLSRPDPMRNDKVKPYGGDKDKSYDDDKDKSYNDDKRRPDDDDERKPYDDNRSERQGQCSVGKQHCCNQVNKVKYIHSLFPLVHY